MGQVLLKQNVGRASGGRFRVPERFGGTGGSGVVNDRRFSAASRVGAARQDGCLRAPVLARLSTMIRWYTSRADGSEISRRQNQFPVLRAGGHHAHHRLHRLLECVCLEGLLEALSGARGETLIRVLAFPDQCEDLEITVREHLFDFTAYT